MTDSNRSEEFSVCSQNHEAVASGKRYGELMPKKKPLISKDHKRAFFDSADWALCKQGVGVSQNSTVAIETLSPKLQEALISPLQFHVKIIIDNNIKDRCAQGGSSVAVVGSSVV
ncbi:uncharacterized protein [Nicotiana tomentosiformis]|uniref:uncharacterized protein isoform X1 n=1 Tax=Nicotiana tomentosiformis TaxID=4098 RepID=UPI00051C9317|nr:uncharacterized protein LOC104087601 isoform X1 [Nicotiana tomentosiformis]